MSSKSRCPFSYISSLQWNTFGTPVTSSVPLKLLIGKDLGAVNLNWFEREECGTTGFTQVADLGSSLHLTDVETGFKDEILPNLVITGSDSKFVAQDVTTRSNNTSHELAALWNNSFLDGTALPSPKISNRTHMHMTENDFYDKNNFTDVSVSEHENGTSMQCFSPVLQDISGRSSRLIWSPVTQPEESPEMRFPAFRTPQSCRTLSSTPNRLTLSLGIDPGGSSLHWSPSMETPTLTPQSRKLQSKVAVDENCAHDCKVKDQSPTVSAFHEDNIRHKPSNWDGTEIIKHSAGSSTPKNFFEGVYSPRSQGYPRKQKNRKLLGTLKNKTRQLFHSDMKDDCNDNETHCDSDCHENSVDNVSFQPFAKRDLLCLPSESSTDLCAPVLQKNISNTLEFLFASPSTSQDGSKISKKRFRISFQIEENILRSLFYSQTRALFSDMYIIDMNRYLPRVWSNMAVCDFFVDASGWNKTTVSYLPGLSFQTETESSKNHDVMQLQVATKAPLLCFFKSRISEDTLKDVDQSYSLLRSLHCGEDYRDPPFSSQRTFQSTFSITQTITLSNVLDLKALSDIRESYQSTNCSAAENCFLSCTGNSASKSNESCLCSEYKWKVCSKDEEIRNLSNCLTYSNNLLRPTNYDLVQQSGFSEYYATGNLQACTAQENLAQTSRILTPKRKGAREELGLTCTDSGNPVLQMAENVFESRSDATRIRNLEVATFPYKGSSPYSSFASGNNTVSNMVLKNCSVFIDLPLTKGRSDNLGNMAAFQANKIPNHFGYNEDQELQIPCDKQNNQISHFDSVPSVEALECSGMPEEVLDLSQTALVQKNTESIPLPLSNDERDIERISTGTVAVKADLKPNEMHHDAKCISDCAWTQSSDNMDNILACLPSQTYTCLKPAGVIGNSTVSKDLNVAEYTDSWDFGAMTYKGSENSGSKTVNPFVNSDVLLMNPSFSSQMSSGNLTEETLSSNCETASLSKSTFLPESIPSQFFRFSGFSTVGSAKPSDKKSQASEISDSPNEIKMTKSVDLLVDAHADIQAAPKDTEKPVEVLEKTQLGLDLSQNFTAADVNSCVLYLPKADNDSKKTLDEGVHLPDDHQSVANISPDYNNFQREMEITNVNFPEMVKIFASDNKEENNVTCLTDGEALTSVNTVVAASCIKNSVISDDCNSEIAKNSFGNSVESCALDSAVANRDADELVPHQALVNKKQNMDMKTYPVLINTEWDRDRCNYDFYSCLSQDEEVTDTVSITSNTVVTNRTDDDCAYSNHVFHNRDNLSSKNSKKFNECRSFKSSSENHSEKPLPVQEIDIPDHKNSFLGPTKKISDSLYLKDDKTLCTFHMDKDIIQLPQGNQSSCTQGIVNSKIFVDEKGKEAETGKIDEEYLLIKESKATTPQVDALKLGTHACELEPGYQNDKDVHQETAFVGFRAASGRNINISDEALQQAITLFNQICDESPVCEKLGSACGRTESTRGSSLKPCRKDAVGAKRKVTEIDVESNLEGGSTCLGFQTAPGKKLRTSEGAVKIAEMELDEISAFDDIANENLFATITNSDFGNSNQSCDKGVEISKNNVDDAPNYDEELAGTNMKAKKCAESDFAPLVPECSTKNSTTAREEERRFSTDITRTLDNQVKIAHRGLKMAPRERNEFVIDGQEHEVFELFENVPANYQLSNQFHSTEMESDQKCIDYETHFFLSNIVPEENTESQNAIVRPCKRKFDGSTINEKETANGSAFSVGFKTALGHKIRISDEALKVARAKLTEIDLDERDVNDDLKNEFSTSLENDAEISPEALEFAAKILDDSFGSEISPSMTCPAFEKNGKVTSAVENFGKETDLSFSSNEEEAAETSASVVCATNDLSSESKIVLEAHSSNGTKSCSPKTISNELSKGLKTDVNYASLSTKTLRTAEKSSNVFLDKLHSGIDLLQESVNKQEMVSRGLKRKLCEVLLESRTVVEGKVDYCERELKEKVEISEEALSIAKTKLQEYEASSEFCSLQESDLHENFFSGFEAAGAEEVKISGQMPNAVTKNFGELSADSKLCDPKEIDIVKTSSGLQTSGNDDAKLSWEASRSIRNKIEKSCVSSKYCESQVTLQKKFFPGFKTAAGDEVKISDKALSIAKKKLEECHTGSEFCSLQASDSDENCFSGSETSGIKEVKISEKMANAVTKNFGEVCADSKFCDPKEIDTLQTTSCAQQTSVSNEVKPSLEASRSVRKNYGKFHVSSEYLKPQVTSSKNVFLGFQTAAGEAVTISELALNAAKRKLDEACALLEFCTPEDKTPRRATEKDLEEPLVGLEICRPLASPDKISFPGFKTAAGEEVKISEQDLCAAKKRLEDVCVDVTFCNPKEVSSKASVFKKPKFSGDGVNTSEKMFSIPRNKLYDPSVGSFPMFQTAAGDAVKISEQAMDAAKKKLEVWADSEQTGSALIPPEFQTVAINNNNEIQHSGEALNVAQKKLGKSFDYSKVCEPTVCLRKTAVPGFQTAAGDEVKISEQDLCAAKRRLEDVCVDVTFCNPMEVSAKASLFKKPKFSGDGVNTSEKMLSVPRKELYDSSVGSFPMFQTAAGDAAKISEQAINAAKKKLELWAESEQTGSALIPPEFQTVAINNNNEVQHSGKALKVAQKKLGKSFDYSEVCEPPVCFRKTALPGFQTAAGDEVKISEQAINAAKKKLEVWAESEQTGSALIPPEFQTVAINNNNEIQHSGEVLKVAQKKLGKSFDYSEVCEPPVCFRKTALPGFQTAAGDEVKISDEALSIAKKKLEEYQTSSEFCCLRASDSHENFSGFQTAAGEKVNISDDAINAAKQNLDKLCMDQEKSSCHATSLPAFQTAGGDAIEISENALIAAKKKLENACVLEFCDEDKENSCKNSCTSFHTEAVSKVKVSERTSDVTKEENLSHKISSAGFHSAAGDKICVSENALNAAKRKLAEADFNDQDFREVALRGPPGTTVDSRVTERSLNKVSNIKRLVTMHDGIPVEKIKIPAVEDKSFQKPRGDCALSRTGPLSLECATRQKVLIPRHTPEFQTGACEQQREEIESKPKEGVIPGKLWLLKSSKSRHLRTSLRKCVGNSLPGTYSTEELLSFGVKESTLHVVSKNAGEFIFTMDDHFSLQASTDCKNIVIGDNALLTLGDDFCAGKSNFYRAFLTIPGVSVDLISEDWFYNHYRWIILKLASFEISFPKIFGGRYLLPEQVMFQMKWRYDWEIDNGKRSALKKILERDDTPSKTMVLFVSSITETESNPEKSENNKETNTISMSLSDGWYEVPGQVDLAMCQLIKQGKVPVGQKLIISGAELVGSDAACSPLEIPPDLRLKISSNSTRRARWDCKLGYFRDPRPFLTPLTSLLTDGGCVSCVKVVIVRTYPILFMEKYLDGSSTLRNEKMEILVAERHEKLKQSYLEKLASEVEKSMLEEKKLLQKKLKSDKMSKPLSALASGREICQVMEMANDPESIQSQLNSSQIRLLSEFLCKQREEEMNSFAAEMKTAVSEAQQQGKFPCDRVVTPLLKVYVKGIPSSDKNQNGAMLTVWRPHENVFNLLTEGKALKIYYLSVSRGKALELQLNSNKATRYEEVVIDEEVKNSVYSPRQVTSLKGIGNSKHSGILQDVDVCGIVIHITPLSNSHSFGPCQVVYIADAEFNSLAIRFWNGVASLGFQDLLQVGRFVSASNLKIDSFLDGSLPKATANIFTAFSTNPKGLHLQTALQDLKAEIQDADSFVQRAREHLQPKFDTPKQNWNKPCLEECSAVKKQLGNSKSLHSPNLTVHSSKAYNLHSPKPYPMYSPVTRLKSGVVPRRFKLAEGNDFGTETIRVGENKLVTDSNDSSPFLSSRSRERTAALEKYGCLPAVNAFPMNISPAASKPYKSPKINSSLTALQRLSSNNAGVSNQKGADAKPRFSDVTRCEKDSEN